MITALLVSNLLVWLLLLLLAIAVLALYRHFGQLYINSPQGRTEQGPETGSHLLSMSDTDASGRMIVLPMRTAMAMVFADTTCTLCATVRSELATLRTAPDARIVVLCAGRAQDVAAWAQGLPENVSVIHDRRSGYANKYEVNGTPYAVVVGESGMVHGKSIVNGAEGVRWIVNEIRHADAVPIPVTQKGHDHS